MSSIDERVVSMQFDNAQFERGTKQTLGSLKDLTKGLQLEGGTKGLDEVSRAAGRFSLANVTSSVQNAGAGFVAMATIGITALSNLTSAGIAAGANLVNSLTVAPVMAGLSEYETQLNSVQTILANTQSKGSTLEDVNRNLSELNSYADQTIYNFAEMARNIGTFTAAGVGLDESTAAIKGIANLAALSGSNSQQASTAMYQLSQAMSSGTIRLMDWNSVVNAGMGGQVFQDALTQTARNHGVAVDDMIAKNGSFRESLQEEWLSADIMSETLSKFTGDLTDQQLLQMGYTQEQIVGIQEMARTASDAATKVKTVSQLIGTLQEAAQSGWAQTWQLLFGDFEEAKEMFTEVNNVLGGMVGASSDARNNLVKGWKDLGGRTVLIEAISAAFNALMAIIRPIGEAFKTIFPPTTAETLYNMTVSLRDFAQGLMISDEGANALQRTFQGVFAVFDILFMVIKAGLGVFADLFGQVSEGSGTVLDITGNIGDFLVGLRDAIKEGEGLTNFFQGLKGVLAVPIALIQTLTGFIAELFDSVSANGPGFDGFFERVGARFAPLGRLGEILTDVWGGLSSFFSDLWTNAQPAIGAIGNALGQLGTWIGDAFQNADWGLVLEGVNVGLMAGLVLIIQRFLGGGGLFEQIKGLFGGGGEGAGFLQTIKDMFGGVTETLSAMQNQLKAKTLITIAGAIALLAGSMLVLALIDPERLAGAMLAMTVMFGQLGASMMLFEKYATGPNIGKMPLLAASMILMGIAVNIYAAAVSKLANLSWEQLAKGLGAMSVIMTGMVIAANRMSANSAGLVGAGIGMIAFAFAIRIMATAIGELAGLGVESITVGMAAMALALAQILAFNKLLQPKNLLEAAIGLAGLGGAMNIFARALKALSDLSYEELTRGMVGMAGALLVVAGATKLMPPNMIMIGIGLIAISTALLILSNALTSMSGMSWDEIGRGLTVLAGSLVVIALAVTFMGGALAGAAALLIVAGALTILVPVLQSLGMMSWESIGTGLGALALAFGVIAVAGLLMTPLIPVLLGLGVAIALLAAGALMAGVGILAFGMGLTALVAIGSLGAAALIGIFTALASMIPMLMQQIGLGIIAFANVIATSGPALVAALVTVLMSLITAIQTVAPEIINTVVMLVTMLLNAIIVMAPQFVTAATVLITSLVNGIVQMVPFLVESGLRLIVGLLNGIANQVGPIIDAGFRVVTEFMSGISRNIPKLLQQGADMIIDFVNSLADTIRNNQSRMESAGANLADAIIDGMVGGISNGINSVITAAQNMANSALQAAKDFLGINSPSREFTKLGAWSSEGMSNGILDNMRMVTRSSEQVGASALDAMRSSISGIADMVTEDLDMDPVIRPVLDLSAIRNDSGRIGGLLGNQQLSFRGAQVNADAISSDYADISAAKFEGMLGSETKIIEYTQNIHSPKPISTIDVYRNTNNQISTVKELLKR